MDIKEIIEEYIDREGISRAELCQRMGKQPQQWSSLAHDAKWPVACAILSALGFDLEAALRALLYDKASGTGFMECPKCHAVWKLKVEEE